MYLHWRIIDESRAVGLLIWNLMLSEAFNVNKFSIGEDSISKEIFG